MADVGVRELKRRLSEYLDRAERGEVLRVTDRGRAKALIVPLPDREDPIARGVREGWITPGTGGPLPSVRRWKSTRRMVDVLDEDRGD
jgi:prevent-host-death family protein